VSTTGFKIVTNQILAMAKEVYREYQEWKKEHTD
jgi:hypothetical protein